MDNVAVKIVSKKKLSEEDLASLQTEIQILKLLNHPHIIKYDLSFAKLLTCDVDCSMYSKKAMSSIL